MHIPAVEERTDVGDVFVRKFPQTRIGHTAAGAPLEGVESPALRPDVLDFRQIFELRIEKKLFEMPEIFQRGNHVQSQPFRIGDDLRNLLRGIGLFRIEKRGIRRAHGVFEIEYEGVIPVFRREIGIGFDKIHPLFLPRQIDLQTSEFQLHIFLPSAPGLSVFTQGADVLRVSRLLPPLLSRTGRVPSFFPLSSESPLPILRRVSAGGRRCAPRVSAAGRCGSPLP